MNTRSSLLLTAYYDGQCGLCSAEMGELHALDVRGDIALVDCSAPDFADEAVRSAGLTREDLLGAMHVRDALGDWPRGVDAIALLYATVGAPWLARAWAHPLMRLCARRHQQRHVPHCTHGTAGWTAARPGPEACPA